jgi:hypothetical protein
MYSSQAEVDVKRLQAQGEQMMSKFAEACEKFGENTKNLNPEVRCNSSHLSLVTPCFGVLLHTCIGPQHHQRHYHHHVTPNAMTHFTAMITTTATAITIATLRPTSSSPSHPTSIIANVITSIVVVALPPFFVIGCFHRLH